LLDGIGKSRRRWQHAKIVDVIRQNKRQCTRARQLSCTRAMELHPPE
jgi:hypothetical protein